MGMEFITVRADSATVKAFDEEAKSLGKSRSQPLRELMITVKDCQGILSAKRMERLPALKKREDRAAEWLLDNMPSKLTPDQLYVLSGLFHLLASDMMGIKGSRRKGMKQKQVTRIVDKLEALGEEG